MKKMSLSFFRNVVSNCIIGAVLIVVFSFSYAGGVLNAFSSGELSAIYHGNVSNKKVSLMINVYWGTEYIDQILQVLSKNNIKSTFFVGGMWVEDNPDKLRQIYDKGHEIANHGYFHKDHKNISYERNYEEINITHELVKSTINVDMNLFAPPSGAFSDITLEVASSLGYRTIMWTRDTIDWRDSDENVIYSRAIKNVKNGDLILMHPTKSTANVLEKIIEFYVANDYSLTTVSDNLL